MLFWTFQRFAIFLWLASWQTTPPPTTPNWPFYAFWQYGIGTCPGVGACDLDKFMGTLKQLKAYGAP